MSFIWLRVVLYCIILYRSCYFEEVRVIVAGLSLEYFSMVWREEVIVDFAGSATLHLINRNGWGWLY